MALPSALQTVALTQLEAQFWSLVESMHDYFAANPTAASAAALAHLEGLADPAPNDDVKIVDRTALFNWLAVRVHPYDGKATAYLSLRQLLLDHPKAFIRALDNDLGRSVTSKAEAWWKRMTQVGTGGFGSEVTNAAYSCVRDPVHGFVTSETWTGTLDGVQRSVTRTFTNTLVNGAMTSTPSAWTVV